MAGPTKSNRFTAGLRAQQRQQVSDRHRRAGLIGGMTTATRHPGKHAEWGRKARASKQK